MESHQQLLITRLQIFNLLKTPVWIFDIENACMHWANQAAIGLWDASDLDELLQRDMATDMSSAVRLRLQNYLTEFENHRTVIERWTFFPKGMPRTVLCTCSGITLDDGRLAMLVEGTVEQHIDADTLRSVEALRHTSVMISLYDREGRLLSRNPSAAQAFGSDERTFLAHFADEEDGHAVLKALERVDKCRVEALVNTMPEPRWHQLDICRTVDPANGATMILVSESDVTERKLAEQRMFRLAHHDPLTGLPNRTLLQDRLERALVQVHHPKQHVAVLFIDLDRFKPINDSLGHQVGDQLLKAVAKRLSGCVRERDTVARVGGDEFVIVLPNLDDRRKIDLVAQKLYLTLAHPFTIDGHELHVAASIGISIYPEHGTDARTLMKHADIAMYEAKQAGRDRCHLHFATSN